MPDTLRPETAQVAGVPRDRIDALAAREGARFAAGRPATRAALGGAAAHWLNRVPMHWMRDWPLPFPLVVVEAQGARITDLDGYRIDDFCLGDTGSLFGHSPAPVARAIRRQATRGLTYMLPTEDALAAGALLTATFGPFRWQVATTATDANRFALRVARAVTGRPKVLVFDGCYHGTVDEAMIALHHGRTVPRPGLVGQVADLTRTGIAVPFNDIAAVEAALATGEVAAVLTEPVMTNSCMVLPEPGFHAALRAATRRHGALLIIDETHTLSTGHGGYTRVHGLDPDIFVAGKAIAGGVPCAVWGLSADVADLFSAKLGT
jgi:glutamate-1-semialdehyde 2,1-aminomutase